MKVYWGNHGGWRWAWGLEVARLRLSVGTARYPEYITVLEMLVNMLRLERWPGAGWSDSACRFTPGCTYRSG